MSHYRNTPERILARTEVTPGGCWNWTGSVTRCGYGQVRFLGRVTSPHRVSYEHHIGPIPVGLQIDHLCRNTICVNPEHLEAVTITENLRRENAFRSLQRAQT